MFYIILQCFSNVFSRSHDNKFSCLLSLKIQTFQVKGHNILLIFPSDAECKVGFSNKIADIKEASAMATDFNTSLCGGVRSSKVVYGQTIRNYCCTLKEMEKNYSYSSF